MARIKWAGEEEEFQPKSRKNRQGKRDSRRRPKESQDYPAFEPREENKEVIPVSKPKANPSPAPEATIEQIQRLQQTGIGGTGRHQSQGERPELEPCPTCGGLKQKERPGSDGIVRRPLTCYVCYQAYEAYRQEAALNIAKDPANAPALLGKFAWVVSKIDPDQLQVKVQEAEKQYRLVYEEQVISVLRQRGYLDKDPEWEGTRVRLHFTQEAFRSGEAEDVRRALHGLEAVKEAFKAMRRAQGQLEVAPTIKADLEKKLAQPANEDPKA